MSPDGKTCTDHNECAESGMCANGICINMNGSFKCHCENGFKLSSTGYACIGMFIYFPRVESPINHECTESTHDIFSIKNRKNFQSWNFSLRLDFRYHFGF